MSNDPAFLEEKVVIENSTPKKSKKKLHIVIGVIIILILIIVGIIKMMSGPANGKVAIVKPIVGVSTKTLTTEGKTFSFQYPSVFVPAQTDKLADNDIEKMSYVYRKEGSWNLDISIHKLPSGDLISDSSYNLRKTNIEKYSDQVATYAGNPIHIITDISGGYNKVAFIPQSRMIAYVALNSNSAADTLNLNKVLDQILSTWKWM
jgi:hypothetical protein